DRIVDGLALRVYSRLRTDAGFAVLVVDSFGCRHHLRALFGDDFQRILINLPERSRINVRIALHWIIFTVKFADPFAVNRLSVGARTVDTDAHHVRSGGFEQNALSLQTGPGVER